MQAGLLLLLSGVILFAFRKDRRLRGDSSAHWLAAAYLTSSLALALLWIEHPTYPRLTLIVGNALLLAFPGLASRALSETMGQPRSHVWTGLLALDAVTVAAFAHFSYTQPQWMLRSWASGVVTAVLYGWLIRQLRRTRDRVIQPAITTMACLFALHIVINAARLTVWRYTGTGVWFSGMNILTIGGVALSYLWMESLRARQQMERTAMTDPLTGLYNRRALDVIGVGEVRRAALAGLPSSALMLDVDRFKDINDRQGHSAGDSALRALAAVVQSVCDMGMRTGGDEFFVLLPGTGEDDAAAVAARIRLALAGLALQTPWGEAFPLTVSIGCATLRGHTTTVSELMHASDILLYAEKQMQHTGGYRAETSPLWNEDDDARGVTFPAQ